MTNRDNMRNRIKLFIVLSSVFVSLSTYSQRMVPLGLGWANNSVNTTIFRKNSLVSHNSIQFAAYYDTDGYVVLAKRNVKDKEWQKERTQYTGNVKDAHNSISIMLDGDGYLHLSWDHHGQALNYAKSIEPYSLTMGDKEMMTTISEGNVTYPEFYKMPNGNLIFIYRDGSSGRGNLVLNAYDLQTREWTQVQNNLIDGENARNAYWQCYVDKQGTIHLSWVWRESWLVETNHDMCYARSRDEGATWTNSKDELYETPITLVSAEYAARIEQDSELINQTSMTTDAKGNPYIATYWSNKETGIPQYHIVYNDGKEWNTLALNFRQTSFSLKGGGTKKIPISRPQLVSANNGKSLYLLFRDEERNTKASMAICKNIKKPRWEIKDLTDFELGSWEPSFDTELWKEKRLLHLFIQSTTQVDGEGQADVEPSMVYVLEVDKF